MLSIKKKELIWDIVFLFVLIQTAIKLEGKKITFFSAFRTYSCWKINFSYTTTICWCLALIKKSIKCDLLMFFLSQPGSVFFYRSESREKLRITSISVMSFFIIFYIIVWMRRSTRSWSATWRSSSRRTTGSIPA